MYTLEFKLVMSDDNSVEINGTCDLCGKPKGLYDIPTNQDLIQFCQTDKKLRSLISKKLNIGKNLLLCDTCFKQYFATCDICGELEELYDVPVDENQDLIQFCNDMDESSRLMSLIHNDKKEIRNKLHIDINSADKAINDEFLRKCTEGGKLVLCDTCFKKYFAKFFEIVDHDEAQPDGATPKRGGYTKKRLKSSTKRKRTRHTCKRKSRKSRKSRRRKTK